MCTNILHTDFDMQFRLQIDERWSCKSINSFMVMGYAITEKDVVFSQNCIVQSIALNYSLDSDLMLAKMITLYLSWVCSLNISPEVLHHGHFSWLRKLKEYYIFNICFMNSLLYLFCLNTTVGPTIISIYLQWYNITFFWLVFFELGLLSEGCECE